MGAIRIRLPHVTLTSPRSRSPDGAFRLVRWFAMNPLHQKMRSIPSWAPAPWQLVNVLVTNPRAFKTALRPLLKCKHREVVETEHSPRYTDSRGRRRTAEETMTCDHP